MSKIEKIYTYIDEHLNDHVDNLQKLLRQPSISQSGEGMEKTANLLKKWLYDLGCEHVELVEPEYHWPIVYGKYDADAEKTLISYGMYDVQPVEEEAWDVAPFEAQLVKLDPFEKVVMNRGATNTKGPMASFLNAFESIKETAGELPVNVLFVFEGEEEMGSVSMPHFVKEYKDELSKADGVFFATGCQEKDGLAQPLLGSEGILYIELETNGKQWGRGPTEFGVHGAMKRILDSPAWRHIDMLSTLTSNNGNEINIDGWYDKVAIPTEEDTKVLTEGYREAKPAVEVFDPELIKETLKVNQFKEDLEDPAEILKERLFSTSFNLDGIWGGWTGAGTKTLLPHKVTSKHNIRFVPEQNAEDLLNKIKKHLKNHGYTDVEVRKLSGYTWARGRYKSSLANALYDTFEEFRVTYTLYPPVTSPINTGPAWPAYLFAREPLNLPLVGGHLGHGNLAHSPNEYYVIEGCEAKYGKVYGLAGAEKSIVSLLYHFASK